MFFLSVLHAGPFSKVHLSLFSSVFILVLSSPWLIPPLWDLLRTSVLFHLNFLLSKRSSRLFQDLSRSGTSVSLSASLFFLFFLFFFPPYREEACDCFFALFPPGPSSVLRFILLLFLFFSDRNPHVYRLACFSTSRPAGRKTRNGP